MPQIGQLAGRLHSQSGDKDYGELRESDTSRHHSTRELEVMKRFELLGAIASRSNGGGRHRHLTAKPKLIDPSVLARADRIITIGCDVEDVPRIDDDCGFPDPKGQPIERVREIRELIANKSSRFSQCDWFGRRLP